MASTTKMVVTGGPYLLSGICQYLFTLDPTLELTVRKVGDSFVVYYDSDDQAKPGLSQPAIIAEFGETSYAEYFLCGQNNEELWLRRVMLPADANPTDSVSDRIAALLDKGFGGEAECHVSRLIPASTVNLRPIKLGYDYKPL